MIDSLAGWIRQLILLLIAAGLVDMALPRGNLRRYVDVVVGLVIVATILSPLLGWLGSGWEENLEQAMTNFSRAGRASWWDRGLPAYAGETGFQAADVMAWRQAETERLFTDAVSVFIRNGLTEQLGLTVKRVDVFLAHLSERQDATYTGQVPLIEEVAVWVAENDLHHRSVDEPSSQARAISPVRIELNASNNSASRIHEQTRNIQRWIHEQLGVDPAQVTVMVTP